MDTQEQRHFMFKARNEIMEAMGHTKGLMNLLYMVRTAIEDGIPMEVDGATCLIDLVSSIEMRLDATLCALDSGKAGAA